MHCWWFLVDEYGGESDGDYPAVGGAISLAGGGLAADEDGAAARKDGIRRTGTEGSVAHYGGWHAADEDVGRSRAKDRAADVGLRSVRKRASM